MNIHEVQQRFEQIKNNPTAMMTEGPALICDLARYTRLYVETIKDLKQRIEVLEYEQRKGR